MHTNTDETNQGDERTHTQPSRPKVCKRPAPAIASWARRYYCPGCKSTITVTGTWMHRRETVKHTCEVGGDDLRDCSAPPPDAPPTGEGQRKSSASSRKFPGPA
jgi:hypothetical protein